MCGLYGLVGQGIITEDLGAFKTLAIANLHRGIHATGLVVDGNASESYQMEKLAVNAVEFYEEEYQKSTYIRPHIRHNVIMGHNRHATVGDTDEDDNAHPFEVGNLTVFHNGTLVDEKYLLDADKTDSEQLAQDIERRGLSKVVEEISNESAFTVVTYDKAKKVLEFVRNTKRTLFFTMHKTRAVMYYSSAKVDLEYALNRNNIPLGTIYTIDPGYIMKVKPGSLTPNCVKNFSFEQVTLQKAKPKPPMYHLTDTDRYSMYN
jgi:glutamine phosphoribosylpyrophosphate amidotransferase